MPVQRIYSDNAGELKAAAEKLEVVYEASDPDVPVTSCIADWDKHHIFKTQGDASIRCPVLVSPLGHAGVATFCRACPVAHQQQQKDGAQQGVGNFSISGAVAEDAAGASVSRPLAHIPPAARGGGGGWAVEHPNKYNTSFLDH